MFLFIAILWYLQVLIPNTNRNISDIDAVIEAGTKSLNKMNTSQVIKSEPVQSFLNTGSQFRNRVEQIEIDDSAPILD